MPVKGWIVVDDLFCKGCELCTSVCPKNLIHMASQFSARGYRPATLQDPEGNEFCVLSPRRA